MPVTVQFDELPAGIDMTHPLTPDEFFEFCVANPDLRVELSPEGRIKFMPPCALESDYAGTELVNQLANWAKKDGRGRVNGSSAGFTLPDGSVLSPERKRPALTPFRGSSAANSRGWFPTSWSR
jgi:Uma2 family endonuclease